MASQLVITDSAGRKRTIEIASGQKKTIGRSTGNDIVLADEGVAPSHCTVENIGSGVRLIDHAGKQGTFLNSEKVDQSVILRDGDFIGIGNTTIEFNNMWKGVGVTGGGPNKGIVAALTALIMLCMGTAAGYFSRQIVSTVWQPASVVPAEPVELSIVTAPEMAMVFIDNEYQGTTPLSLKHKPGRCVVRLQLSGYETRTQSVNLTPDKPLQKINVPLVPVSLATLEITSTPSDAEVFIDDLQSGPRGLTPLSIEVSPGEHEIILQKTNYIPWKNSLSVAAGENKQISAKMEQRNIASYLKLLKEDPNNVSYYSELAHLYILEKKWDEAKDALRNAMEIYCRNSDTSNYAGRMKWLFEKIYFADYFEVADRQKHKEIQDWIIELYAEMASKYKNHKPTLKNWLQGILNRAGRGDELDQLMRENAAEGAGPDLTIYFQASEIYIDKKKYARAVNLLSKACELGPKNYKARLKLAETYLLWYKSGNNEAKKEATKNFAEAFELCKDDKEKAQIKERLKEATQILRQ